jgi:hypothetical protein
VLGGFAISKGSAMSFVYTDKCPNKSGYYFCNNGYIELIVFVYPNSKTGELMYATLPSIENAAHKLSNTRDGLLWCRIDPPNSLDQ